MSDSEEINQIVTEDTACYFPGWLLGMPDDWWQIYFDRSQDFAISLKWGHA